MKCLKSILLGITLFLISGVVLATGSLQVSVNPAGENKTVVFISNAESSKYEIELANEEGDVIYYKMTDLPEITYSKYYNFSMLEDGVYNLTVKVDKEKKVNTLMINNGQVEVIHQRKEVEPYFTVRENHLVLSYLNFALENLSLMVYENNTLIYQKKLEPEFAVNYGLDISGLKAGIYEATLSSENSIFEYKISK